jgi:hypothetical protein
MGLFAQRNWKIRINSEINELIGLYGFCKNLKIKTAGPC